MKTTLTNRFVPASKDGWIVLSPYGEFPHREGMQVVNREAVRRMVANHAGPVLIDRDHESHDMSKRTEALGWIEELRGGNAGLEGRVRWTDLGQEAISAGTYRFISPVWEADQLDNGDLVPVRLTDAGLTNRPNLPLPPLSNRQASGTTITSDAEANQKAKPMKQVAVKLGLSPEASEEAVLAAVTTLANRADSAEAKAKELETKTVSLSNRVNELTSNQVDSELEEAGVTEPDRVAAIRPVLLTKNREERQAFLAACGFSKDAAKANGAAATKSLTNRAAAKQPGSASTTAATTKTVANRMREQQALIAKHRVSNRTHEEAFNAARAENPALFEDQTEGDD